MVNTIILSNDNSYVNNIRSKCIRIGAEIEHLDSVSKLISYIMVNKRGVVLLDVRHSSKIISLIYDNFVRNGFLDFKFICLNDFSNNYGIDIDEISSFTASASNVSDVLEKAYLDKTHLLLQSISDEDLKLKISNLINAFSLPSTMKGYDYLIECVKYRIKNIDKNISLSNDIYPYLADLFNEDISNIEKCIRVSVNFMSKCSNEEFVKVFGDLRVTTNIFVNILAKHIIK